MQLDQIKGIIPPILTPIDDNEKIDEARLRRQVNTVIEGGVHGILVFGSNGEFYMVEDDEMERGLRIVLDECAGRVPVYMGIGAIGTRRCIRHALMAERLGAFGISVLQPMFIKPTEGELALHFSAIAHAVSALPVLLYNNPGRTGYSIPTGLVVRLAQEVENIVGIKDSSGDMTQTAELIRRTREFGFKVFGGKDTLIFGTLAHGGAGAVATTANFCPQLVCEIYNSYVGGDLAGSLAAQYRLNPVRLSMDGASFPVATKDMARLSGLDVGEPYRPNLPSEGAALEAMRREMAAAGLL